MVRNVSFGSKFFDFILVFILVSIAILCILPIWYTLVLSLSDKSAAAAGEVWLWPVGFNFNSYAQIMQEDQFFKSFWISVKRVFFGATLNFIITVLMAYPLSKNEKTFPKRNIIMWILIFTMLFNGGIIPLYLTVKGYGLLNSIWSLVLVAGAQGLIFNIILTMNYFRNLPKELEESALIDGADPWQILFKIYVPVAVPVLATITLFSIVMHWNEFFQGLMFMTREENYPLQTYIQQLVIAPDINNMTEDQYKKLSELSNRTLNAAKIFIAMIPVLLVYPFLQRYFMHGITLGSIKE